MNEIKEGYLRVTAILDYFKEPHLVEWMIKKGTQANKLSKQAMKVGTEVDESIKQFINTAKYGKVKTIEAKSCLEGFKKWYEDYNCPPLKVGERLYNDELGITGEPDILWYERVIDVKCALEIRPKYHVQTGIYAFMKNFNQSAILRLHKHLGDYEYQERSGKDLQSDIECFLSLLKAYRYFETSPLGTRRELNADSPAI